MDSDTPTLHRGQSSPTPVDPAALLAQLGCEEPAVAARAGAEAERFCSFCWSAMAPADRECASCGATAEQMEAARRETEERDRAWVPERRSAAAQPEPEAPAKPVKRVPPKKTGPDLRAVRGAGRGAFIAVGLGAYLLGAIALGTWLGYSVSPGGSSPEPIAASGIRPTRVDRARVRLQSPAPDVVVELLTPAGLVLAASDEPRAAAGVRVRPGDYRLRISDRAGRWRAPEKPLKIGAGERRTLTPDPKVLRAYRGH